MKEEIARNHPELRFAYSRPGFVTYRLPKSVDIWGMFQLRSVFARTWGISLGPVQGKTGEDRMLTVLQHARELGVNRIHIWQRDQFGPGHHGYEPGLTDTARRTRLRMAELAPRRGEPKSGWFEGPTIRGHHVLDCILVDTNRWYLGCHVAREPSTCWTGGMWLHPLPTHAINRAWIKMDEALAWSRLPIQEGQVCAEIGCAPGGASQRLLQAGLNVIGIDPAIVDESVLGHPNFTHLRKRGTEVRRKEFRDVHWLMADMNVTPNYTLDTIEGIVSHPEVNIAGMLLTLKLVDWKLAREIPGYLDRIRSWGFSHVQARQLHHNRQDFCVAVQRTKRQRRRPVRKTKSSRDRPHRVDVF